MVDSSDRLRLELVRAELDKLLQQERLAGATLLVLCNKVDLLASDRDATRTVEQDIQQALGLEVSHDDTPDSESQGGTELRGSRRHWKVQSCSAVTGDGLMDGLDWLVEDIGNRISLLS